MLPSFCGAMGTAGWLVMLLMWGALIAVVVWAITRLFPDRTTPTPPPPQPPPPPPQSDKAAEPIISTGRR